MTTGRAFGELWSRGARDWASYVEPQYQLLYETVHDRLGIRNGMGPGCWTWGAAPAARHSLLLSAAHRSRAWTRRPIQSRRPANVFRRAISASGTWKASPGRTGHLMWSPVSTPFSSPANRWLRWRKFVAF